MGEYAAFGLLLLILCGGLLPAGVAFGVVVCLNAWRDCNDPVYGGVALLVRPVILKTVECGFLPGGVTVCLRGVMPVVMVTGLRHIYFFLVLAHFLTFPQVIKAPKGSFFLLFLKLFWFP